MGNSPGTPEQQRANKLREEEIKQARIAIAANKKAFEARSRREAVASGTNNLPPKTGEFVWSSWGPGVVDSYDADTEIYHIIPAWRVADDGQVHLFLHAESVMKDSKIKDEGKEKVVRVSALSLFKNIYAGGQRVTSPFGAGEIVRYDIAAGTYKVSLDWEMDGGAHAIVFAQPDVLKREVRAKKGDVVLTPYGTGIMKGVRPADGIHVVNIKQVAGEATAYLSSDAILRKLPAAVGSWAMSSFGPAYILGYRQEDHVYTVVLPYAIAYIQADQITGPYTPPRKGDNECIVM